VREKKKIITSYYLFQHKYVWVTSITEMNEACVYVCAYPCIWGLCVGVVWVLIM